MTADRFPTSAHRLDGMHQTASFEHDASSQYHAKNAPIHTPALNAVVVPMDEEVEHSVVTKPTWNERARAAKSSSALIASMMFLGGLLFLDLHPRMVARAVAATLRPTAAAHGEDAPWTPPPIGANPWQPTPYAPIQLPGTVAGALVVPGAPLPAATFYVPPFLTAAPAASPAPTTRSTADVSTKNSKTKKHST